MVVGFRQRSLSTFQYIHCKTESLCKRHPLASYELDSVVNITSLTRSVRFLLTHNGIIRRVTGCDTILPA